jgi:hypothetical protein
MWVSMTLESASCMCGEEGFSPGISRIRTETCMDVAIANFKIPFRHSSVIREYHGLSRPI